MRHSHSPGRRRVPPRFRSIAAATSIAVVGLGFVPLAGSAQTINFIGPDNGDFLTAANYDLNRAPVASDIVGNATANTALLSGASATISGFTGTGAGGLTIGSGGTLTATNQGVSTLSINGQLNLQNGGTLDGFVISSPNAIAINGSSSNSLINIASSANLDLSSGGFTRTTGTLALTGGASANIGGNGTLLFQGTSSLTAGTITFTDNNGSNRVGVDGGAAATLASGTVIEGNSGRIGDVFFVGGNNTLTNNGTIRANVSGGTITVVPTTFNNTSTGVVSASNRGALVLSGSTAENAGSFLAQAGSTLTLDASTLTQTSGTVTVESGGTLALNNGGQIIGGTLAAGDGGITFNGSSSNLISNVTGSVAFFDLSSGGFGQIGGSSTLALNGTSFIGNNGNLLLSGTAALNASGTITFADANGSNRLGVDGGGNVTLGGNLTVRGNTGRIGDVFFVGGSNTLTNNGTIFAEVSGGTITILPTNLNNNGTLIARLGTLALSSTTATNTGLIDAQAGGTVIFNGSTITQAGAGTTQVAAFATLALNDGGQLVGGTLNAGSGTVTFNGSSSNLISNVTGTVGSFDLANGGFGQIGGTSTLTLTGTSSIGGNGTLLLSGTAALNGSGEIVFADINGSNRLGVDGGGDVTLGADLTVRGNTGRIGDVFFVGGNNTLTNNGTINADTASGTITVLPTNLNNTGTLTASNGGTLVVSSSTASNTGTIRAQSSSSVTLNGSTVTQSGAGTTTVDAGGTLALNNGGQLVGGTLNAAGTVAFNGSSSNLISGVTATINNIDVGSGGFGQLQNSNVTLNGTATIGGNGTLLLSGNTTVGGTSEIVFADANGSNRLGIDGGANATIGAGVTVRGNTGSIGEVFFVGGSNTLTNNGTIASDGGGTITVTPSNFANNGTLTAAAGSTLTVQPNFTQSGGAILADGTVNLNGGATVAGGIVGGDGTLNGALAISGGTLTGGGLGTIGSLSLGGSLDMTGGVIQIDLFNTASFDQLLFGGSTLFAANTTVLVNVVDGANFEVGDTFASVFSGGTLPANFTIQSNDSGFSYGFSPDQRSITVNSVGTFNNVAAPEPGSIALIVAGGTPLAGAILRRRKRQA